MSIVGFHRLVYPEIIATTGLSTAVISATNQKVMFMLNIPKTGNLTHVSFRTGSVTTPATINIRLETLDSTGLPTGTLINASATGSQSSPLANTNYEVSLAGSIAVSKNTKIAVVFECPSGTPNLQLTRITTPFGTATTQPYTGIYNGTAWTKQGTVGIAALKYDDNTYPYLEGVYPPMSMTASNYNSSTVSFDEAGNLFTVPFQCQVTGFWSYIATATGTFDNVLYDASNNVLATVADNSQVGFVGSSSVRINRMNTPVVLEANTQYRQTMKSTNTTNIAARLLQFDSAAIQEVISGGDDLTYTRRKGTGSWTDTANSRMLMGLIIDGVNESGSSGKFKIMTAGGLVDIS